MPNEALHPTILNRSSPHAHPTSVPVVQTNEVLCKVPAHNVCCVIAEYYGSGIEPEFGGGNKGMDEPQDVQRFPRIPGQLEPGRIVMILCLSDRSRNRLDEWQNCH